MFTLSLSSLIVYIDALYFFTGKRQILIYTNSWYVVLHTISEVVICYEPKLFFCQLIPGSIDNIIIQLDLPLKLIPSIFPGHYLSKTLSFAVITLHRNGQYTYVQLTDTRVADRLDLGEEAHILCTVTVNEEGL